MDEPSLKHAIDAWLAERPMTLEDLADRAVAEGLLTESDDVDLPLPEEEVDDLLSGSDDYWATSPDDGEELVVLTSSFVDAGMTFTHRITAEDLERGSVPQLPDLAVLLWNCRDGLPLADGTGRVVADYSTPADSRFEGPTGWLDAATEGELVALTRTDGAVAVEVVDDAALGDGAAEIEALESAADLWVTPRRGMDETPFVMEAMARDGALFRWPVPPVGELLVAAGLERRDHEWGWADQEWRTRREARDERDSTIAAIFGFDDCCERAFARLSTAFRGHLPGQPLDGRALADDVAHGSVAQGFAFAHADVPSMLLSFATAAADSATGRHRAPVLGLLGLARLGADDPVGAVEALSEAVRTDARLGFAAAVLAELELDRGDLSRAHSLAMADELGEHLVEWIDAERARQAGLRPTADRNDPCPCGSGRKFKKCHGAADAGALRLADRVPFVLQRLGHFALSAYGHSTLFGLVLSAATGHRDLMDAVARFRSDSFLIDVAVHEGGLGEAYLDQRGALLAADEVAFVVSVLDEPRRLWEITAVEQGDSLTMRDTGSGEVVTVVEHSGSQGREAGELMLARIAETDGVSLMFGVPLLVPLRQRDRVLALLDQGYLDADMLASWYGSLSLPPELTNREGEPLVLRRTVLELEDDPDVLVVALDDLYGRDGEELRWTETTTVDGEEGVVRGTISVDGSTLVVESNSYERQERILEVLDDLVVFELIDDTSSDVYDAIDAHREERDEDEDLGASDAEDMPDEVRALVEQKVREYEERWCDEPVPALAGLTPRQALDDPTRREDLFALLRDMRRMAPPGDGFGMSAERIEELLGIGSE